MKERNCSEKERCSERVGLYMLGCERVPQRVAGEDEWKDVALFIAMSEYLN